MEEVEPEDFPEKGVWDLRGSVGCRLHRYRDFNRLVVEEADARGANAFRDGDTGE